MSVSLAYVLCSPAQCQILFESYWLCWWALCLAFLSSLIKLSTWELIFEFRIIFFVCVKCKIFCHSISDTHGMFENWILFHPFKQDFVLWALKWWWKIKKKVIFVSYISRIYFHIWILIKLSIRRYIGVIIYTSLSTDQSVTRYWLSFLFLKHLWRYVKKFSTLKYTAHRNLFMYTPMQKY